MDYDIIDGVRKPHLTVRSDASIEGEHQGSVRVISAALSITGRLNGSLSLEDKAAVHIAGQHNGSLYVSEGARAEISGKANGSCRIERGATVVLNEGGRLAGSLSNDGTLIVRGEFGGAVSGFGEVLVEGRGRIKEPTMKDGINYYEWTD